MTLIKQKVSTIIGTAILAIAIAYGGTVFASHSFELGAAVGTIPDNTHIRLDGLSLPPGGVLPVYDASPNFVSGHFLLRAPCEPVEEGDDTMRPTITVIAGHIDENAEHTFVDKIPLYYVKHASTAGSCVYHAHIPDPLNGGAPRVTDIDLVNYSGETIEFNPGDAVDINIQQVLGDISSSSNKYTSHQLPLDLSGYNTIYDLNDADTNNDGLGIE